MQGFLKKLRFAVLYSLYLAAFILLVDYVFFYRPYVSELRKIKSSRMSTDDPRREKLIRIEHVDPEVMKKLGKANATKRSTFSRKTVAKSAGTTRVCSFGDSFTEGGEVDDLHDYPTLLQDAFDRAGAEGVEVINFGISGFGFHQAYMMWDLVARNFDCDLHLFGPRGFQPLRDTTFGFIYSWSPYYLHARYVLRGGDVELVEIEGDTYGERFDDHYRFFPRWRTLRYGRLPPMFLKALIPRSRDLPNPFYYDGRPMNEEAEEIQSILLGKIAAGGAETLVGVHRRRIVELTRALGSDHLSAARMHEQVTFPYVAPSSHAGPQGNQLLAQQFFALLTGSGEPLTLLATRDLPWSERTAAPHAKRHPMETLTQVGIEIEGMRIGRFVIAGSSGKENALKVDALLGIGAAGESLLDGCLAPFDGELQPGMPVVLHAGGADHPIGELGVIDGGFNVGAVEAEGFEYMTYKELEHLRDAGKPSPLTHGEHRFRGLFFAGSSQVDVRDLSGEVTVTVGGEPALTGSPGTLGETPGVWLTPVAGTCRLARATTNTMLDLAALPETGAVEIVAEHWQQGSVRAPLATWHKAPLAVPRLERPLGHTIAPAPRDGDIQVD